MSNIKKLFNYLLNLEFYISPLDQFLAKFRKQHPDLSQSQRREKQKYADIFNKRDPKNDQVWDKF